jgi:hypothetical protein
VSDDLTVRQFGSRYLEQIPTRTMIGEGIQRRVPFHVLNFNLVVNGLSAGRQIQRSCTMNDRNKAYHVVRAVLPSVPPRIHGKK